MIETVSRFATNRRVTVAMLAFGVFIFGLIALFKMPVTLLPSAGVSDPDHQNRI